MAVPPLSEVNRNLFNKLIDHHIRFSLAKLRIELTKHDWYRATALVVRDMLVEKMLATRLRFDRNNAKKLYYLSLEFLIGRSLENNLFNLGIIDTCRDFLAENGIELQILFDEEPDAALGNGGLGRLAACFLDSLATLDLPGYAYGINYEYGLFRQEIRDGYQVERPDAWQRETSPWLVPRPEQSCRIPVYGRIEHRIDNKGEYNPIWVDWRVLVGVPSDLPIAGFGGRTVNFVRLYSAGASDEFDMQIFNAGDYMKAVEQKMLSETISKVLYPVRRGGGRPRTAAAAGIFFRGVRGARHRAGIRRSRRRLQRFFVASSYSTQRYASRTDDCGVDARFYRRVRSGMGDGVGDYPRHRRIHQSHAIARSAGTMAGEPARAGRAAPSADHLRDQSALSGGRGQRSGATIPSERLKRVSIVQEGYEAQVRMAHLAIVGSHSVNGVSKLHTELVKTRLVPDFYQLWPERFSNKTNGVTQRRWLLMANPGLASLLDATIGTGWATDLEQLSAVEKYADDAEFQRRFRAIKRANKERLARIVNRVAAVDIDPAAMFDIQAKRIHEYKRQLLMALGIVHQYLTAGG